MQSLETALHPHWQHVGRDVCLLEAPASPLVITSCRRASPGRHSEATVPADSGLCLQELTAACKACERGPPHESFGDFKLVQLDRPVKISGLTVVDDLRTKLKRIDFTNCYFRDGMNCGIVSKGAHDSLIANCIVERTSKTGIEHSIGGEGSFAGASLDYKFRTAFTVSCAGGVAKAQVCHVRVYEVNMSPDFVGGVPAHSSNTPAMHSNLRRIFEIELCMRTGYCSGRLWKPRAGTEGSGCCLQGAS